MISNDKIQSVSWRLGAGRKTTDPLRHFDSSYRIPMLEWWDGRSTDGIGPSKTDARNCFPEVRSLGHSKSAPGSCSRDEADMTSEVAPSKSRLVPGLLPLVKYNLVSGQRSAGAAEGRWTPSGPDSTNIISRLKKQ
jgi:hypothetical protein